MFHLNEVTPRNIRDHVNLRRGAEIRSSTVPCRLRAFVAARATSPQLFGLLNFYWERCVCSRN
ncbi:MAG: hypothetical protein EAS49_11205 [Brucella intermedia]|nr:MAG: hypothetical protein EAS49_11205 [Brucella intermedia]